MTKMIVLLLSLKFGVATIVIDAPDMKSCRASIEQMEEEEVARLKFIKTEVFCIEFENNYAY